MAVGKCKDCGGAVSSSAKACPHCGAVPPKRTSVVTWLILAIFAFPVLSFVVSKLTPQTAEQVAADAARAKERAVEMARSQQEAGDMGSARSAIKARLKDPESAEFDSEVYREPRLVCGHYNAKNSFGGYVGRTGFMYNGETAVLMIHGESASFAKIWNERCAL